MQGSTRSIDISYAERHGKESNQYDAYDINNTLHNTYIYIYIKLCVSYIIWVARWLQAIYDIISFDVYIYIHRYVYRMH